MNKLQKYGGILAIIALLVACVSFFVRGTDTIVERTLQTVGGTSPEISSPYIQVNGVREWYNQIALSDLSASLICSIKSPAATTTLHAMNVRISSGNTSASSIRVYKAATATATTTSLFGALVGAGAKATFNATTTTDNFVIGPSQYINVDTSTNYSQVGTCNAIFLEI